MRWIEVDVHADSDPKLALVIRRFGNEGYGTLIRLWQLIARKGARPGMAVDGNGVPFELRYMADQVGTSQQYLRSLLTFSAKVEHIDADLWAGDRAVLFPALAKRSRRYHEAHADQDRSKAYRDRRFDRIAKRDGKHCCHCGLTEQLELERKVPREDGGRALDENLQIACLSCSRKRRIERASSLENSAARHRTPRQNATGGNVRSGDPSIYPVVSTGIPPSSVGTHTHAHDDPAGPTAEPERLPLIGSVPNATHRCHAWCGRKCVPDFLHAEFLEALGGPRDAADGRLRAFYAQTLAAIPRDAPIAPSPPKFWRAFFERSFTRPAAVIVPPERQDNAWTAILARLEVSVPGHMFHTWFTGSVLVEDAGDRFIVRLPSELHRHWISRHFAEPLAAAIEAVRPGLRVEFQALAAIAAG